MKNFVTRTKYLLISICALIISVLSSCSQKQLVKINVDPAFTSYVLSFTSGVVSNKSHIQIRLVNEVSSAQEGKEVPSNVLSISPQIDGKAVWIDKQTIEFIPNKLLPSGEIYTVEFYLDKLVKVPETLQTLTFNFQVIKQAMQYDFNGIEPYTEASKKWQKINGIFTSADYIEPSELEKIVTASSDLQSYKISWKHNEEGTLHSFTIDSVKRVDNGYKVKLVWDASEIGADEDGEALIEMPSIEEFKVLHVRTNTNPTISFDVFFSEPLHKTQDKSGLIKLLPAANESVVFEGNIAHIIPSSALKGDFSIKVLAGIKNIYNDRLGVDFQTKPSFVGLKPQIKLIGEGVIVPNNKGILFPFQTVSLSAVDVKIIKIFENNIPQFLQINQLNGSSEMRRVGRVIYSKELELTSDKAIDYGDWNTFSLDLSKLIAVEPGAIYRVELSFRKKHSLYPCSGLVDDENLEDFSADVDMNEEDDKPLNDEWYYYEDDYYYEEDYNWHDKDDPCKSSYYYYNENKASKNVLASDFGIIAKAGAGNNYFVAITDLRTTEPIPNIDVEFRNYQNQIISTAKTNVDGMLSIKLKGKPFLLTVKKDKQRGYLKLDDGSALSLSMFDIKGEEVKKGIKGFIYGERGVWRPGDSLYLSFILEDKNNVLPDNHPVVFEMFNPQNQLVKRIVSTTQVNGFYTFLTKTEPDAPTGNWLAKVKVGGSVFTKTIRIEMIKPNRLKIKLEYDSEFLKSGESEIGKLQVNWLHGTPAKNAKVIIDATIAPTQTEFEGYSNYIFDDPIKTYPKQDIVLFQGNLDQNGFANVDTKFDIENSPGMVQAQLKTRAFEAGGDFSTDRQVIKYSPYTSYVGFKLPQDAAGGNAIYSNENTSIPIVTLNQNGKPVDRKLKIRIYNVYWRWWWDRSDESNLADYISNQYNGLLKEDYIETENGKAMYTMNLGGEYWGRKLIIITDEESGHSTGSVFYTTYKGWWSNAESELPEGAEMLNFNTDKSQYNVGEKVSVTLPATHSGRALISIESGSKIIQTFWFKASTTNSKFTFVSTPEMAPNIFIHITFIQPHNHSENDYPIRMYGVKPVKIENPNTHLEPKIQMASVLKPEENFTVKVSETKGKPMTYTIAIVDEGLLDITRFKTPNPWNSFYLHEALGVKTWDIYKYVAGAFTGKIAGLYAIGGDEYLNKNGKENNNRFKPVVIFKGPFVLKAGEVKNHTFTMPNYVGSVRVMVIAGQNGAYGSAEEAVPVKQDLMVLPTIPRIISPSETIKIPVTVFALNSNVKEALVTLKPNDYFDIIDASSKIVAFEKSGEKTIEFTVKFKDKVGNANITISAVSGNSKSKSETDLKIRMPNPPISELTSIAIKPGETWTEKVSAIGLMGTNSGSLEISRMFPINLEKRLDYLISYPYGCLEQVTSSCFPQLYIQKLVEVTPLRKSMIEKNIKTCLERLKAYQLQNGGFSYWPGLAYGANEWGTNYVGHFMLEAQALGYQLPVGVLDAWIQYQQEMADNWQPSSSYPGGTALQAYRLYTLALAKSASSSAMNRLRETPGINDITKWRLAAAYCLINKPEIASKIVDGIPAKFVDYKSYYNYGSYERELAMVLETLVLLGRESQAKIIADELAKGLSSDSWYSTQSTAFMLIGISKFIGNKPNSNSIVALCTINDTKHSVLSTKPFFSTNLNFSKSLTNDISIKNISDKTIYLKLNLRGIPEMKNSEPKMGNLQMNVQYFDKKWNKINPISIKQGTDFYMKVEVQHPGVLMGYYNMALSQLMPSGWEIIDSRLDEIQSANSEGNFSYQDIRDDGIYTFFDLARGQKLTFTCMLHAAYVGRYYLPSVFSEAMYDNTIFAKSAGQWVEVIK